MLADGVIDDAGGEGLLQMDEEATANEISSWTAASSLVANDDVHLGVALHETGNVSAGLANHYNTGEAL